MLITNCDVLMVCLRLLQSLLQHVYRGMSDDNVDVRSAAMFALGQFSIHLQVHSQTPSVVCVNDFISVMSQLINQARMRLQQQHPFNGPLSWTTRVSRYQKGKTSLDFTEARDSEWQWHQLGRIQICTLPQLGNHASTQPLSFL